MNTYSVFFKFISGTFLPVSNRDFNTPSPQKWIIDLPRVGRGQKMSSQTIPRTLKVKHQWPINNKKCTINNERF